MDNKKDIEKLFKDHFENFEVDPGKDVWSKIKSEISPNANVNPDATSVGSKVISASSSWMSTIIIGAIITGTIVGSYLFFEKKTESKKIETKASQVEKDNAVAKQIEVAEDKELENTYSANTKEKVLKEEKSINKVASENIKVKTTSKGEIASSKSETETIQDEKTSELSSQSEIEEIQNSSNIEEVSNSSAIQNQNSEQSDMNKNSERLTNSKETPKENQSNTSSKSNNKVSENSDMAEEDKSEEEVIMEQLNAYPLPNVFTPNQDGKNDFFEINIQESSIDGIEVAIFDRTGNLIKQWNNPFDKWDGNLADGTAAPKGLYLYQIILKKGDIQVPRKGVITLNR